MTLKHNEMKKVLKSAATVERNSAPLLRVNH